MSERIDATHDSSLRSWVQSANDPASDFPIQNLPLGVFRPRDASAPPALGVAIGDRILSLPACIRAGMLGGATTALHPCLLDRVLNPLMGEGREAAATVRAAIVDLLSEGNSAARRQADEITVPMSQAELLLPADIGDYTDFYASIHHATNVGGMFRPDNPLLPNYKYIPIGYHGRSSSIVVSGTAIHRPSGQTRDDPQAPPTFGPTRRLDYELEVGVYVGRGNARGLPIPLTRAEEHLWGVTLVNDWSARDIQSWEYQPLGPFLAKNFATSVSPWVVTLEALAPFRVPMPPRGTSDPQPLEYLRDSANERAGAMALTLEVWLQSASMRAARTGPIRVSTGTFADMYWTAGQLVTHHASNGCNLRPGDLLASGTVSGPLRESRGCLLERTWRGTEPLELPSGERRAFLEDGDEVIMRGYAERDGFRRIGLGECRGVVSRPNESAGAGRP